MYESSSDDGYIFIDGSLSDKEIKQAIVRESVYLEPKDKLSETATRVLKNLGITPFWKVEGKSNQETKNEKEKEVPEILKEEESEIEDLYPDDIILDTQKDVLDKPKIRRKRSKTYTRAMSVVDALDYEFRNLNDISRRSNELYLRNRKKFTKTNKNNLLASEQIARFVLPALVYIRFIEKKSKYYRIKPPTKK
ncbi:MAG: hypothetical protein ACTSX6_08150 [Candidatus Heimdallarchaeaceae archaeon]